MSDEIEEITPKNIERLNNTFERCQEIYNFILSKILGIRKSNVVLTTSLYLEVRQELINLRSIVGSRLYMYKRLMDFTEDYLKEQSMEIASLHLDDRFFKEYCRVFYNLTTVSKKITNLSMEALNSMSISQSLNLKPISHLTLEFFSKHGFDQFKGKIISHLGDLFIKERQGEFVDIFTIKNVLDIFRSLDVICPNLLYEVYIPMLTLLHRFYKNVSDNFIFSTSIPDYLKKGVSIISFENSRIYYSDLPVFKSKVLETFQNVFVREKIDLLYPQFEVMLREDRFDDLHNFYITMENLNELLVKCADCFKYFIVSKGQEIIKEGTEKLKFKSNVKLCGPIIDKLLGLFYNYSNVLATAFNGHTIFLQAFDFAFKKIINVSVGFFTMPEVLNIYVDMIMRGIIKVVEDTSVDTLFKNIVTLFSYIDDKDFFFESYQRSFAGRLISGSTNQNLEESFIHRLKIKESNNLISKIEAMYHDVVLSRESTQRFKDQNKEDPLKYDMNVFLLNSSHWPIRRQHDIVILNPFLEGIDKYTSYFMGTNGKKKLIWCIEHSYVVLNHYMFTPKGKETKIECHMTMTQASILLLFNHKESNSLRDIYLTLNIQKSYLISAIIPLITNPVPLLKIKDVKSSKSVNPDDINDDTVFEVVLKKKVLKRRVVYKAGSAQSDKEESKVLKDQVLHERNSKVDLAIVRIMKTRKNINHQDLFFEVSQNLMNFFMVEVNIFKKRIECLIEKEYIGRDESNPNIYYYIA